MVWDSKDAITYFVREANDQRMLVTVPRKDGKVKVVAYDHIFCMLFGADQTASRIGKP